MVRMILCVIAAVSVVAFGQEPSKPTFEVASIKPASGSGKIRTSVSPMGITVSNTPVRNLIEFAYQVRDFQVLGGPTWIDSEKFDIAAKPKAANVSSERIVGEMQIMLQMLLADRFKLKLHRTTNELPVYALTVARSGPRMRRSSDLTCPTFQWSRNDPPPNQPPVDHCGARYTGPNERLNHTLDVVGMSIAPVREEHTVWMAPGNDLTTFLSRWGELDHLVIDKTGLKGLFDFHLEWSLRSDGNSLSSEAFMNPSILIALEDQLGLKLVLTKGGVEALVIDHVERPTEN